MERLTFYLLAAAVVAVFYAYMQRDKWFGAKSSKENFGDDDDGEAEQQDEEVEVERSRTKDPPPPPAPERGAAEKEKEKESPAIDPKAIMSLQKDVQELNENVLKLLGRMTSSRRGGGYDGPDWMQGL
jgi:FtsZ-interacting cell division protein ZipA